jgi:hypothetical protein
MRHAGSIRAIVCHVLPGHGHLITAAAVRATIEFLDRQVAGR